MKSKKYSRSHTHMLNLFFSSYSLHQHSQDWKSKNEHFHSISDVKHQQSRLKRLFQISLYYSCLLWVHPVYPQLIQAFQQWRTTLVLHFILRVIDVVLRCGDAVVKIWLGWGTKATYFVARKYPDISLKILGFVATRRTNLTCPRFAETHTRLPTFYSTAGLVFSGCFPDLSHDENWPGEMRPGFVRQGKCQDRNRIMLNASPLLQAIDPLHNIDFLHSSSFMPFRTVKSWTCKTLAQVIGLINGPGLSVSVSLSDVFQLSVANNKNNTPSLFVPNLRGWGIDLISIAC